MRKKRNIALCVLFTIITFGIYGIYWFIKLTNEINSVSGEKSLPGWACFLLSIVTLGVYSYIWVHKKGIQIESAYADRGIKYPSRSILYVLMTFFGLGLVTWCMLQHSLNGLKKA